MDVPTISLDQVPEPVPETMAVLDVREPAEWAGGHIDGAIHIPLMDLPQRLADLPPGHTVVVCKVGGRSAQAVGYLVEQAVDAVNLDGGMLEWEAAGRSMVSETGHPPLVV